MQASSGADNEHSGFIVPQLHAREFIRQASELQQPGCYKREKGDDGSDAEEEHNGNGRSRGAASLIAAARVRISASPTRTIARSRRGWIMCSINLQSISSAPNATSPAREIMIPSL